MSSNKEQIKFLKICLKDEIEAINFYIQNLDKLNLKSNSSKITELVLGCVRHSEYIIQEIVSLQKDTGSQIKASLREKAMKEEAGMKDIYKYELNKTNNSSIKKMLTKIIDEESKHEKIALSLK